ncbi:unnamed protein product [Caenorhabditis brenneri]
MNLLFKNSTDFWVPSYLLNDTSYIKIANIPLLTMFLISILITIYVVLHGIKVINGIRKLHSNATWIILSILAAWFEGLLGFLLVFPYKFGVWTVGEPSQEVYFGLESKDYLSLDLSWKCVPLLLGSILIWHYLGMLNGGILCFVFERTVATLLARDYESHPRRWLSISLHISHHLIACFMCLFFCFHMLPLKILLFFNALGFVVLVPYIFFLRFYNRRVRNQMRLAENITSHSLAAKFQVEENMRSMNIAARIAMVVGIFDVLFLIIIVLATCQVPNAERFFQTTEFLLVVNPLFLIPGVMTSVAEWKTKFMAILPINRLRIDPNFNPYVLPVRENSNLHFSQLESYWI